MKKTDRLLGMAEPISRRDFVNGVALTAGSLALPMSSLAAVPDYPAQNQPDAAEYPPHRLGLRGSHPGSFEAAHELRDRRSIDTSSAEDTGESYDLVVVGGGLSGLSAAQFFLKNMQRKAKVLILDNHDDFGGHAKRNELIWQGRMIAINGGTLEMESPARYNQWAKQVLADIGVDIERFRKTNEELDKLYSRSGLRTGHFFDKQTFGRDRVAVVPAADAERRRRQGFSEEYLKSMPISDQAKRDLMRIQSENQPDYMPGLSQAQKKERLAKMSYQDFLMNVAKVDKQAYWFYSGLGRGVFCVGADAIPALFAWSMGGHGFSGMGLEPLPLGLLANLPGGQHGRQREGGESVHFPDGNATLARLLVRWLVPEAVPGKTQEDLGTARVNYAALDQPSNIARIRLNSVVLNVRHDGDMRTAQQTIVTYNTGGKLKSVKARSCIMACWNMFIPYLIPDLPQAQKEALSNNVKGPIVYTNVFLRNWKAFQKLGAHYIDCPTMYHDSIALAEPCDLGDLHHARSPDDPVAVRMIRTPSVPGLPRKDQHRAGRAELLATSFETFERNIRDQLMRVLGPSGFDAKKDIIGLAVNRWPHGYSYTYNSLYDPPEWVYSESDARPCVTARKPFGLISIANSDAAASPHTDAAILEAHRAVTEVLDKRGFPFA